MALTGGSPVSGAVTRSSSFLQLAESSALAGSAAFGRSAVSSRRAFCKAWSRGAKCPESSISLRSEIKLPPAGSSRSEGKSLLPLRTGSPWLIGQIRISFVHLAAQRGTGCAQSIRGLYENADWRDGQMAAARSRTHPPCVGLVAVAGPTEGIQ